VTYYELIEPQAQRFRALVQSLTDHDGLCLVRWFGNGATTIYDHVVNLWDERPYPVVYDQAFDVLMADAALSAWVLAATARNP